MAYDKEVESDALRRNREIWRYYSGADPNYDMEFERICFCPEEYRGPFKIRVRLGVIESATYLSDSVAGSTVDPDILKNLLTVDGVFNEVQAALDRGYADLRVTYDETGGYPTSVYIDTDTMIADDEMTFVVRNVALSAL